MMRQLTAGAASLAALALLVLMAWHYPAPGALLGAGLALYIGILLYRPALWLLLVPALLPILDFAPLTGWFFFDELDLLLLATCVGGYARLGREKPPTRLPGMVSTALVLLTACVLVAAARGMLPLAPLDANSFANYASPYNGLRVLKGFLWPLVLLPLLRHTAGQDGVNLRRLLLPGMLLGLAGASLAVVWERDTFPGLMNFSSDYRPTAPFSAMHTGGAALDAYLAMAFPFVGVWLIGQRHHPLRLAAGLGCLLLGCFAGLTIFSRDIYLAYAASGAVIGVLSCVHYVRGGALRWSRLLALALMGAVLVWLLSSVFGTSGYRGLLASLGLLTAAVMVGGADTRLRHWLLAAAAALALLAAITVLEMLGSGATSKGAYIGYVLAALVCGAGSAMLLFGGETQRAPGFALVLGALPALAVAAVLVARHWGGDVTLPALAPVLLLAAALAACRLLPHPPFRLDRATLTTGFFAVIVLGILIPITGSYYTGSRFSTVGDDLEVRLAHWDEALDMMDKDSLTQAFGQGLGRYPDTYMWRNTHGEMPGTFRYEDAGSNRYLRLGTAQYAIGYGEMLRMLQHVDVKVGKRYVLSADYRASDDKVGVRIIICERWLLYPQNCVAARTGPKKWQAGWQHMEGEFPVRTSNGGLFGTPVQLEIAADAPSGTLDVDNVSIREVDTGRELVRNGSFSDANDYWFFSSDRNHMPWHVKNFAVNTVFELGWVGAGVTAFFLLAVGAPLVGRGLGGDVTASIILASLTGCMMVGLFDSITDVPRLTILFLLLALAGNLQPVVQKRKRRRRSGSSENQEAEALMA